RPGPPRRTAVPRGPTRTRSGASRGSFWEPGEEWPVLPPLSRTHRPPVGVKKPVDVLGAAKAVVGPHAPLELVARLIARQHPGPHQRVQLVDDFPPAQPHPRLRPHTRD